VHPYEQRPQSCISLVAADCFVKRRGYSGGCSSLFSFRQWACHAPVSQNLTLSLGAGVNDSHARPEQLVLDLEEVELDWRDTRERDPQTPPAPSAVAEARLIGHKTVRSLFVVARATNVLLQRVVREQ
jgi:hypothetical protein